MASYHTSSSGTTENLPPKTVSRLVREVRDLLQMKSGEGVEGVRLIVDVDTGLPSNLGELMAEIEGPVGTPYENKYFQIKLIFCQQYPAVAPRGYFLTKIYHPNVDITTGTICVNTLKKDWTSNTTLSHVLNVIRCLLIVPFPESSLNDEAGKLFMESYTEYYKRSKLMADVHGRTSSYDNNATTSTARQQLHPIITEENSDTHRGIDSSSSGTMNDKEHRILKSSSLSSDNNPLRSSNNTQNSNNNNNSSLSSSAKNSTATTTNSSSSNSMNANKKLLVKQKSKSLKRL